MTTMEPRKQKALEAAGFQVGDAADFLELSGEERSLVELRLAVSRAIRERRKGLNLSQAQVAARMKSTQARVAKIEAGDPGVSLDLMFSGLFAVGGGLADLTMASSPKARRGRGTRRVSGSDCFLLRVSREPLTSCCFSESIVSNLPLSYKMGRI